MSEVFYVKFEKLLFHNERPRESLTLTAHHKGFRKEWYQPWYLVKVSQKALEVLLVAEGFPQKPS